MAARRKYDDVIQIDASGWSDWVHPVQKGYRLACCTCGLTHEVDYRIEDGHVEYRMRIDRRATANAKRRKP